MSDFPIALERVASDDLARIVDADGKIARAIAAIVPLDGARVLLLGARSALRARQLRKLGATVVPIASLAAVAARVKPGSLDAVVGFWTAFRGVNPAEVARAERLLKPGGRLIAVHDYGRDDVSRLAGDRPEYGPWGRRDGPFLRAGFKIHVVHCWWTFESLDSAAEFLRKSFGSAGTALAAGLHRPRLSWNVAIYHRSKGVARPV